MVWSTSMKSQNREMKLEEVAGIRLNSVIISHVRRKDQNIDQLYMHKT